MKRRTFLAASPVLLAPHIAISQPLGNGSTQPSRTEWIVRSSEGYDALSFLSPLSGDSFYHRYYEEEVAAFRPRLSADILSSIIEIKDRISEIGALLSPYLDLIFSNGNDGDIPTLLAALTASDSVLRPSFENSPYWSDAGWAAFEDIKERLRTILIALQDAGFAAFRADILAQGTSARIDAVRDMLAGYDVVREQERYTGRVFDPAIEVVLLYFCRPHGIKVQGQQFLSSPNIPDNAIINTAAHELLHPPVDFEGAAARAAMTIFERDSLLHRIVEEHDPAFGYNSLLGLVDEDLASAIDQVIGERLGVARDPADRWNSVDDGMHILAAAFYNLMHRSGFAETGGDLDRWLGRMALYGWLAPASLHGAAAQILGRPATDLWPVPG